MSRPLIKEIRVLLDEIRALNGQDLNPITITRLRTKFNARIIELADSVEPTSEFDDRMTTINGRTSLHQLKWGTLRLLDDPDNYRRDSAAIGLAVREFLDWCEDNTEPKGSTSA